MKIIKFLLLYILTFNNVLANEDFNKWLKNFKVIALNNDISENTINLALNDAKFLPDVIKYDRYQPEFYEDTKTYIDKRVTKKKNYEWNQII